MQWHIIWSIFVLCLINIGLAFRDQLLVISYGGFVDWKDYRDMMPRTRILKNLGAMVNNFDVEFPMTNLPFHMTIATGLKMKDLFGMYNDVQYDDNYNCNDLISEIAANTAQERWKPLEPIWVKNQKINKSHSGLMMWPGGSKTYYSGPDITYFHPQVSLTEYPLEHYMNIVISWLKNEENPANLVLFHIDRPGLASEMFGPESVEVMNELQKVDLLMHYMMHKIYGEGRILLPNLHVVIITDHRTHAVKKSDVYKLPDPSEDFIYCGKSPVVHVHGTFDVDELKRVSEGAKVYSYSNTLFTSNLSENLAPILGNGVKKAYKFPTEDIIVVAHQGHGFSDLDKSAADWYSNPGGLLYDVNDITLGVTGYDMPTNKKRGLFKKLKSTPQRMYNPKLIAFGPKIKKKIELEGDSINSIYNLLNDIIGREVCNAAWCKEMQVPETKRNDEWYTSYFPPAKEDGKITNLYAKASAPTIPEYPKCLN